MQEDNKELTKEEKIEKAKVLMNEIHKLELTKEELDNICGGSCDYDIKISNHTDDKEGFEIFHKPSM